VALYHISKNPENGVTGTGLHLKMPQNSRNSAISSCPFAFRGSIEDFYEEL
jgi:hypothetical protein